MQILQMPSREEAYTILDGLVSMQPALAPEKVRGRIVLYGAGNLGLLALRHLKYVGVSVEYAMDINAKPGMTLDGELPVYSPLEAVPEEDLAVLVTTVSTAYTLILEQLTTLGFKNIIPFYDYAQAYKDKHPINNGWFSGLLDSQDIIGIRSTLGGLEDPWSWAAYLQMLAWRTVREDWLFADADIFADDRYFVEPVLRAITQEERFIDIGAYDGRVLIKFLEITNGRFASAHLFEPDNGNIRVLYEAISELPPELSAKVDVCQFAVSAERNFLFFSHGFEMASRLSDIQAIKTPTIALDDMQIEPSFIKMHIEGGEYDALRGGLNLLTKYRPILAVTMYHNRDGLWRIPQLLMQALDNYVFYFRLHCWCGTGAVLYALPKERIFSSGTEQ